MRDNFTKRTIDILAKRVGFLCSNPSCRKHTVGPHNKVDKSTSTGIAAHITAASIGGPRYDDKLSQEERVHIDNAIWLCSSCSSLIDKDEKSYTIELLKEWKTNAEGKIREAIQGKLVEEKTSPQTPYLEADLIWHGTSRWNRGYSSKKNHEKFGGNVIPAGGKMIIFWELKWRYKFALHNNSSFPAYNVKIEQTSDVRFTRLTELPKINNLPPFQSIDIEAVFSYYIEDIHTVADEHLRPRIPERLEGLEIKISYQDEQREQHETIVKIISQEILNKK